VVKPKANIRVRLQVENGRAVILAMLCVDGVEKMEVGRLDARLAQLAGGENAPHYRTWLCALQAMVNALPREAN
jgi:hypothetical protein